MTLVDTLWSMQGAVAVAVVLALAYGLVCRSIYRQRAQREVRQLRSELARSGRVNVLGQLAAALAHQLAQPLASILRNAEAAELQLRTARPDLDELRAILADVRRDDRRAVEFVDQLRALIRRRSLELRPLALNEVVRDVLALVRADAVARQVALECVMPAGLPLVAADRVHLSQVLLNLLVNGMDALEARQVGSKRVVIEAHPSAEGGVEVAVTDSGPGVPCERIDSIFEPFFTTKAAGMGMGLPISRTIIEAHGGRLWAERGAGGRGLSLRFTLCQARGQSGSCVLPA